MTSEELEHQDTDALNSPSEDAKPEDASASEGSAEAKTADEATAEEVSDKPSEVADEAETAESETQPESDESATEEAEKETDGESSPETDEEPNADSDSEPESESNSDGEATTDADADTETDTVADDDADTDAVDTAESEEADAKKKRRPNVKKILLILAAALLIVLGGCCIALAVDDSNRMQSIPNTTMLDKEVDVSGLTQDEFVEMLETRAEGGTNSVVTLSINGTGYDINLLEVGTLDTTNTASQAFAPYNTFALARWGSRAVELVTGNSSKYDIYTAFDIDHNALKARVEEIAKKANTEPKNAGYDFDSESRKLVTTPPIDGIELNVDATVAAIEKSIVNPTDYSTSRFVVEGVATVTAPEVLESGQAILVDTRVCRVYLYEAGQEVVSYACTPGQSGYATPKGNFYLQYKDPAPTWINPHSEWSEGMPDTIGPGASNPLGLRALAVSCGGGIYIHGTTNTGGLGYPGSHGCIRLSNTNIIDLYDRVSTGIPIIIR